MSEAEDRVDYEEDNYIEETEYDVEEEDQANNEDHNELNDENPIEHDDTTTLNDDEMEKHSYLLSLPPHGSEVFIGGLPKNVLDKELEDLCHPIGEVSEIRIVKDKDTGEGKGYAFVAFKSKDMAQMAIEELHNKDFKGKTLRCSLSESKNRLFIGNIPKIWSDEEFRKVVEEVGPGVDVIELIKDPQNPSRNRGFAFVLYYNNACADYSKQKMSNPNFNLDGNSPTVSWADPKASQSDTSSSQVKALYVKNIPENTTPEHVKELFLRHGDVVKVVMPPGKAGKRDFAFIHYAERSSALKAVKDSEKYEIDGKVLEVVLAKPQAEKKSEPGHPSHSPYPSFGGVPFQQPVIYGRGPMPSGMQMVPMVLPDGRIGYVLQQPGMQLPRRLDRSRMGSAADDSHRNKRFRPH